MADMSIYRGEYKVFECTATEDGSALVLTGAAIYFAVRETIPDRRTTSDADALIAKSTASGISITSATAGGFEITIAKADTNGLTPGTYNYGIEAVLSGYTDPVVLDVGTIDILESYVRAT